MSNPPVSRTHRVRVRPLPGWLDWQRLLGPGEWSPGALPEGGLEVEGRLTRGDAADLAARLRGVVIAGEKLMTEISPALHRSDVRKARLDEARRYRRGSPGFLKPSAQLDDEARRLLTPEALAVEMGERARGLSVIDACCGAGGNAIGFARAGCRVTAIDLDPTRLAMAVHNAGVYKVAGRIEFICGDAVEIVPTLQAQLLFVDPPWVEQAGKARTTLAEMPPLGRLVECAGHIPGLWAKVPASFDPGTLPGCTAEALFGVGEGDARRVKFLLLQRGSGAGRVS